MFGMLSAIKLSQPEFFKMAEGRWQEGMEEQSWPWLCHVGRWENSFLGLWKASAKKVWTFYFSRLKVNILIFHFEMTYFLLIETCILQKRKTCRAYQWETKAVLKNVLLQFWKKRTATRLFIDMSEVLLAIIFVCEEKKKSWIFLKLSSIGKVISAISLFSYKSITFCFLMETWTTECSDTSPKACIFGREMPFPRFFFPFTWPLLRNKPPSRPYSPSSA